MQDANSEVFNIYIKSFLYFQDISGTNFRREISRTFFNTAPEYRLHDSLLYAIGLVYSIWFKTLCTQSQIAYVFQPPGAYPNNSRYISPDFYLLFTDAVIT